MGCSTCGGGRQSQTEEVGDYVVRWPDGSSKTVKGERQAKVELVLKPGGSYAKV
jgi:hypothetical protein